MVCSVFVCLSVKLDGKKRGHLAVPFNIRKPPNEVLCILPPQKSKLFTPRKEDQSAETLPPSEFIIDQGRKHNCPLRNGL